MATKPEFIHESKASQAQESNQPLRIGLEDILPRSQERKVDYKAEVDQPGISNFKIKKFKTFPDNNILDFNAIDFKQLQENDYALPSHIRCMRYRMFDPSFMNPRNYKTKEELQNFQDSRNQEIKKQFALLNKILKKNPQISQIIISENSRNGWEERMVDHTVTYWELRTGKPDPKEWGELNYNLIEKWLND